MKVLLCIPARYGSTRFPGKVIAKDTGKFLIQHTYEQVRRASACGGPDSVIIAADDLRIAAAARSFGAQCILTSPSHNSGTDRIAEAVVGVDADIVINVQADEPEIEPNNIDHLAELLIENPDYPMGTLAADFQTPEQVTDANLVKVVVDCAGRALYFSRSPIPYDREKAGIGKTEHYLRHIGIYAYRREFLLKFTTLPQTPLEKIEKLEQLRVIENGFDILVGKVDHAWPGIDTPEQYAEFVKRYKIHQEQK